MASTAASMEPKAVMMITGIPGSTFFTRPKISSPSISGIRTSCDPSTNPDTALFRIDIIKVPLAHPEQAKIVNSPRIFSDQQTGAINGLWKGGNHGDGTQTTSVTNMCHDITVY